MGQVIPEAAVYAAAFAVYGSGFDGSPQKDAWLADFRKALEAAAPHMLGEAQARAYDKGYTHGRHDGESHLTYRLSHKPRPEKSRRNPYRPTQ